MWVYNRLSRSVAHHKNDSIWIATSWWMTQDKWIGHTWSFQAYKYQLIHVKTPNSSRQSGKIWGDLDKCVHSHYGQIWLGLCIVDEIEVDQLFKLQIISLHKHRWYTKFPCVAGFKTMLCPSVWLYFLFKDNFGTKQISVIHSLSPDRHCCTDLMSKILEERLCIA